MRYRDFMGWDMPWYSAQDSLDILLSGRQVDTCIWSVICAMATTCSRRIWTNGRGVEVMDNNYASLDLTVYALEKRDVDREERVVVIRRSFTRCELKHPKTEASVRAVPLQARALEALDRIKTSDGSPLLFPGERGGYLDIHHFRSFQWRPAQQAAGIKPLRRVYDLRHTFATFALRAGISTFDLSR